MVTVKFIAWRWIFYAALMIHFDHLIFIFLIDFANIGINLWRTWKYWSRCPSFCKKFERNGAPRTERRSKPWGSGLWKYCIREANMNYKSCHTEKNHNLKKIQLSLQLLLFDFPGHILSICVRYPDLEPNKNTTSS